MAVSILCFVEESYGCLNSAIVLLRRVMAVSILSILSLLRRVMAVSILPSILSCFCQFCLSFNLSRCSDLHQYLQVSK